MVATKSSVVQALVLLGLLGFASVAEGRRRGGGKKQKLSNLLSTTLAPKLVCPKCSEITCTPKKESKLKCKGSTKRGICGCCPVCAKVEGESCGGEWNYLGECDTDLQCKPIEDPYTLRKKSAKIVQSSGSNPEGTCQRANPGDENQPQPRRPTCKPKCSPSFCKENPKALCSAVDRVDVKRPCQGECQHTTCQACSWVQPEPNCGYCELDDERCIKRYAKCVKRKYCTRQKFPCKENAMFEDREAGKFECLVPKCR